MPGLACGVLVLVTGCQDAGTPPPNADWLGTPLTERDEYIARAQAAVAAPKPTAQPASATPAAMPQASAGDSREANDGGAEPGGEAALDGHADPVIQGLLRAARAALDARQLTEAREAIERARQRAPSDIQVAALQGRILYESGRIGPASDAFAEALRGAPEHVDALFGRGRTLLELGRAAEARLHIDRLARLRPDDPEVKRLRAVILERLGDPRAAREVLGDDSVAARQVGERLAAQGRMDEAIEALSASAAARPDDAEAHLRLGEALGVTNQTERAAAALERATLLNPKSGRAWQELAALRERAGDPVGAAEAYEALLKHAPPAGIDAERLAARATVLRARAAGAASAAAEPAPIEPAPIEPAPAAAVEAPRGPQTTVGTPEGVGFVFGLPGVGPTEGAGDGDGARAAEGAASADGKR